MNKLQELLESRAEKVQRQRELLDAAKAENRDLTPEEVSIFDQLDTEIEGLDVKIEAARAQEQREQRVAAREKELNEPLNKPFRPALDYVQQPKLDNGGFKNLGEFLFAVRFAEDAKVQMEYASRFKNLRINEKTGGYEVPAAFRGALLPSVRNDFSMGTGSEGGFAVPELYLTDVKMLQPEQSVVRPRASVIPAGEIPDTTLNMPVLNQGKNGVYGGVTVQWTAEGEAKPDTTASLKELSLTPQEVSATTVLTNKLIRNWTAASSFISNLLSVATSAAEDIAFLRGDGVGKPKGILNASGALTVNRATANAISFADVSQMRAALYSESLANAVWVANQSIIPQLVSIQDVNGRYIFLRGDLTQHIPDTLYGIPIIFTGRTPSLGNKGDLVLADFSKYLIRDGSGPFIAASPHVLFQQDKTMIRITWNVDGQPWVTDPLLLEDGSTKVSPFVVLDIPAA
ncbi:MAG: phage major capsid protein [Alicyclobacillus sp.]|nr:phage major capsid protein [Alicyclobacillus sp.]